MGRHCALAAPNGIFRLEGARFSAAQQASDGQAKGAFFLRNKSFFLDLYSRIADADAVLHSIERNC
jgi:hypothetical protein